MKKKYIVFGLLAVTSVYGFSQKARRAGTPGRIARSTIQIVYSHYLQNGDHSAVTGGKGTEKLTVYAPEIIIDRRVDSLNSYHIDAGVDVISSASTDRIDFVMSSASKVDLHGYLSVGYDRKLKHHQHTTIGGSGYFSLESDYLSTGGKFSLSKNSKDLSREYSAELEYYRDDLRWGRISGERPLKLVYPQELRTQQWFDEYLRHSVNLNLGLKQTINSRMILGVFPGISLQKGLLSTPFHRVYFTDSSERVEKLPGSRLKIPLGIQLNTFIGKRFILRNYYRFYWDDFGILAHTINAELGIKLNNGMLITPLLRYYVQDAPNFFKSYYAHDPSQKYYSSDYDYSAFHSFEAGTEWRINGPAKGKAKTFLNNATLRYSYYKRSDGLYAHMATLLLEWVANKAK